MAKGIDFKPDRDISDLSNKVIFITGGNSGLGKQTALELSRHSPAAVYITSRDSIKGQNAIAEIHAVVPTAKLHLLILDLGSFPSIRAAAASFLASSDRLDILFSNAGIMAVPPSLTTSGHEIQLGTNHLGHALLTTLLLPILQKTSAFPHSSPRVITLTSDAHTWTPASGINFSRLHSAQEEESELSRYGQSKLANLLYSFELAAKYGSDEMGGIKFIAIHPGMVETGLSSSMRQRHLWVKVFEMSVGRFMGVGVEKGVWNGLWAATADGVVNGGYYVPVGERETGSMRARDKSLGAKLWEWTEKELEGELDL